MKLIDAEQIGLTDMEIIMCDGNYKKAVEMLIDKIAKAPSIDAVPVVRCKDCIHSTSQVSDDEDNYYCNAMRRCMHSLDFCSYAERRTG